MGIDWTKPLETTEANGQVVAVQVVGNDGTGIMPWSVKVGEEQSPYWANDDGRIPGTPLVVRNRE